MAGFCVALRTRPWGGSAGPLRLVSLGEGEEVSSFATTGASALWSRWRDTRQLWVRGHPHTLWWIEGQPDRWPAASESLATWLRGRWGSFRGFEIDGRAQTVTIFGDPLGTRPIYYRRTRDAVFASDKLATLAALAPETTAVNWDALLEQLMTGVNLGDDTSLAGVQELPPGVAVRLGRSHETSVLTLNAPHDPAFTPERVAADPSGTLLAALERAVSEVWTAPESALLLSGGLDSRLLLRLGGPRRRAITVTTRENRESRTARRIARACGAKLTCFRRPPEQYLRVVDSADLLTGMLDDPTHAHFLGLLSAWREAGFHGLAHAYLFDTLLKGHFLLPLDRLGAPRSLVGAAGSPPIVCPPHIFNLGFDHRHEERLMGVLSAEGHERLGRRLYALAGALPSRPVEGLETAIEEKLFAAVSRVSAYGNILSWIEEQDVYSTAFHPSLWSWVRASRPRHRYRGRAFRGALVRAGLDLALIRNANTGLPAFIPRGVLELRTALRGRSWYPVARRAWRAIAGPRRPERDERSWPPLAPVFRSIGGRHLLERGFRELARSPLFTPAALETLLADYLAGDDLLTTTVLALAATGRWAARVREMAAMPNADWLRAAPCVAEQARA